MTDVAADPGTAADHAVDDWLAKFNDALAAKDAQAAAALFGAESWWRDLIAFTWNLKTVEGPEGVEHLVANTDAGARGFVRTEPATEADGVTEAWIDFETEVGRGRGLLRLRDGVAFTLLTTLHELKGHEEPRGPGRPMGAEHGANKDRQTWMEQRQQEAAELGYETQPEVLVIGGGQGGIALGARLRQLDVPTIVIDSHPRPGDRGAAATSRCACTTPSGTTTSRT